MQLILKLYPNTKDLLSMARIDIDIEDFVKRNLKASIFVTIMVNILIFFVVDKMNKSKLIFLFSIPLIFIFVFSVLMNGPYARLSKMNHAIDAEIVSVLRFIILEIKSGRPLFEVLKDISKNFDTIGIYTDEIVNEVLLGSNMSEALNKAVERMPNNNLRIVLWQMLNHVQTGSNIVESMQVTMENIIEEQKIEFKEYGKKLNVIALMYMIMAIILPTIGVSIISTFLVFIGFEVTNLIVIIMWFFFFFVQFMFLMMINSKRPAAES